MAWLKIPISKPSMHCRTVIWSVLLLLVSSLVFHFLIKSGTPRSSFHERRCRRRISQGTPNKPNHKGICSNAVIHNGKGSLSTKVRTKDPMSNDETIDKTMPVATWLIPQDPLSGEETFSTDSIVKHYLEVNNHVLRGTNKSLGL